MEPKNYRFSDATGDASITVCELFPGVRLAYCSVQMEQLVLPISAAGGLVELHYCREGRLVQKLEEEAFELMPGDLSVTLQNSPARVCHFPLRHYHGISIGIEPEAVTEPFLQLLRETNLPPPDAARPLFGTQDRFILRANRSIEPIFSALYAVPESIREGYLKVKLLELLVVLRGMEHSRSPRPGCTLPKEQVRLAQQAAAYLSRNMGRHITIPQLSKSLGVSDTHLKNAFKGVYGMPVFSYMRRQKMQAAAQRLIHTDTPIAVLAEEFGYLNTGKFSAAFLAVMGQTPSEYRRAHTNAPPD